jgi:hypothetical protein
VPTDPLTDLLALFERHGDRHYGEAVSQLDHALQCAACAVADHAPDSLVAAALLPGDVILYPGRGHPAEVTRVLRRDETVRVSLRDDAEVEFPRGTLVSLKA